MRPGAGTPWSSFTGCPPGQGLWTAGWRRPPSGAADDGDAGRSSVRQVKAGKTFSAHLPAASQASIFTLAPGPDRGTPGRAGGSVAVLFAPQGLASTRWRSCWWWAGGTRRDGYQAGMVQVTARSLGRSVLAATPAGGDQVVQWRGGAGSDPRRPHGKRRRCRESRVSRHPSWSGDG